MIERRAWSWRQMLLKSSLSSNTRLVLLTLSMHVNDAGEPCYPTVRMLAKETGLSARVVIVHLDKGKADGWIEVGKHGFSGQKWATNEYKLSWPEDRNSVDSAKKGVKLVDALTEFEADFAANPVADSVHKSVDNPVDQQKKGGDAASPPSEKGGDVDDTKVVTQRHHLRGDHIYGFPNSLSHTPSTPLLTRADRSIWR